MRAPDIPPPDVWGVGRVVIGRDVVPWPVSAADVEDEALAAGAHLDSMDVGNGDLVLLISLLSEAVHVAPIEMAINARGALFSSADASVGDAFRVAALVDQLRPRAVLGVGTPTIEGLVDLGRDPAAVLGPVPVIATRDERAHDVLVAGGLQPRRWLCLGPTSAFECERATGAHLDESRWQVSPSDDDGLVLNGRAPRLTPAVALPVGRGRVVRDPCPCGRHDPRIVLRRAG